MKKWLVLAIVIGLLSGCATYKNYDKISWHKDTSELGSLWLMTQDYDGCKSEVRGLEKVSLGLEWTGCIPGLTASGILRLKAQDNFNKCMESKGYRK